MPASAPGTSTERHRQSVAEYHRIGMRLSALLGPWLPVLFAITLFFTLITSTYVIASPQKFLVCVDPKLQRCITWLTNVEEALGIARKLYFNRDVTRQCGFSDLIPVPPHRKYITIVLNVDDSHERHIFCNVRKIIVKGAVDQLWSKNKLKELYRSRRQTGFAPKGRYRGQTQSQYLAIDHGAGKDDGKAEAHSAADSSRASVSGSSGMGQAQSQTMYDPSCEDCVPRSVIEAENLRRQPYSATQSGMPGGTSEHGGLLPPGSIETLGQNGPGSYGSNKNGPGGYGSSGGPSDSSGYGPNQQGVPGSNGAITPNQQRLSPEANLGSFAPNFPRQIGSDTSGPPGGGSYSQNIPPGQAIYNPNFIPGMRDKPSGVNYGLNQNVIPDVGGMLSPNQPGTPGSNFNSGPSGGPGDVGSRNYVPNQQAGIYVPGQHGTPGGVGSYGNGLDGQPSTTTGVGPGQTALPNGYGVFGQGSYTPSAGGSPGGIGSNVFKTPQSSIPSPNGAGGSLQGAPNILGGNNQYAPGFPGGIGSYNGGSNWPITTGSFQGPDGTTYYCCVASPNNNPQYYKTGGGRVIPTTLPILSGSGTLTGPNNLMAQPGLYHSGTGTPFITGTGGTGRPSEFDGPRYVKSDFLTPGGTGGTDGQYGPGRRVDQNMLQGPAGTGGQTGIPAPGVHYSPDSNQNGISRPGGQYSLGGPVGPTGLQSPGVQYTPMSMGGQPGFLGSSGQYGPGSVGGQPVIQGPGGQYGPAGTSGQNGLQGPNGQYSPGGTGGQNGLQGPIGQYGLGGTSGQNGLPEPIGQYGPGGTSGQNGLPGPIGQYGPGGTGSQPGLPGTSGQYDHGGTRGQSGLPNTGGQYGSGGIGSQPGIPGTGGQYGHGGIGGQSGLPTIGGLYGPGSTGGQSELPGTGGQYGSGPTEAQTGVLGTGGQYGPGSTGGQPGIPVIGGQYGPGGTVGQSGLPGTGGQYGPGIIGGQIGPQSPGGLGVTNGQNGLQDQGGQYGLGTPSRTYGPVGLGGHDGQQAPGAQYGPGSSTNGQTGLQIPGGQYGHAGPGVQNGIQGPGEQYGPGSTVGQNVLPTQGGQYGPAGMGGIYGPGGTASQTGLQDPAGHTGGSGVSGESYVPGIYGKNPYGYDNQGNLIQNGNYNGPPQNVIDPNSVAVDGDDSEAEASVTQGGNGTIATASSKGGNEKGRAQTHVHGAYTGGGSFSAQAEISGENKAANSEVAGDKKGASSQAQGSGRNNKSQANVQLGSETGSVLTGSLSEGVMHSSNTQVQGSVKGGMADAQARGPGSTSSQAQIGFTPYKQGDKHNEQQTVPFAGGGTASAQSSGRTGSSQSQLRGSFKYGITYNGAAQAGASLNKDAVFPNRLPFDKIDVYDENNKNINVNLETTLQPEDGPTEGSVTDKLPVPADITEVMTSSETPYEAKLGPDEVEEEIEQHNPEDDYGSHTHSDHHKDTLVPNPSHPPPVEGRRSFQPNYNNNNADYDYGTEKDEHAPEDYDVDGYGTEGGEPSEVEQYNEFSKDPETHQSLNSPRRKGLEVRQTTGGNAQHIVLGSLNDQDAEITQRNSERPDESKVYQPGERVPGTGGYTIPVGFTGSVKSVASKENTYVVGTKDSPSQAQTVSLTPGSGKVKYTYPATHTRNISPKDLRSLYNPKADDNRYISVSKSVTRALDGENNIRKQYSHTYYTKSSSCGYFTFTCTMVSSAEGRKKVCKPKIPTNPDGTPMRC